jgi:hypothetical protein
MTKTEADALAREIAVIEVRLRAIQFAAGLRARRAGLGEGACRWRGCKNRKWWMEGFDADPNANHGEVMFDAIPAGEYPELLGSEERFNATLKERFGARQNEIKTVFAIMKTGW